MNLALIDNVATMSSLELVEIINTERGDNVAQLRHDHFMDKVPKVLGDAAPIYLGTAKYTNGTGALVSRNVYNLPKREACLMAMSYSYELQAKVFDIMTELERAQAKTKAPIIPIGYAAALLEAGRLAEIVETLALENSEKTQVIELQAHQLDEAKKWASVKRMETSHGLSFKFAPLKKYSKTHGYDMPKVRDANYAAGVNTYHEDVWMAVYEVDIL